MKMSLKTSKLLAFALLGLPFITSLWASMRVISVLYGLMLLWVVIDNYELIAAGKALKKALKNIGGV